jgi:hypothetical protein
MWRRTTWLSFVTADRMLSGDAAWAALQRYVASDGNRTKHRSRRPAHARSRRTWREVVREGLDGSLNCLSLGWRGRRVQARSSRRRRLNVTQGRREFGYGLAYVKWAETHAGPGERLRSPGYPTHYIEWHSCLSLGFQAHLVNLITEGVFERFPGFKVVPVEGGVSWLAPLTWRLVRRNPGQPRPSSRE